MLRDASLGAQGVPHPRREERVGAAVAVEGAGIAAIDEDRDGGAAGAGASVEAGPLRNRLEDLVGIAHVRQTRSSSALEVKRYPCPMGKEPPLLTIGEVARRSGVASSALRLYEERRLI